MVSQKFITQNAQETQKLAERVAKTLRGGETLALYGQLGSGKTTFVQGLARGLGIKKRILSPSFVLIRQYRISPPRWIFYHVDLYRMTSPEEAKGLGLEEIWQDPKNICVIEWAEKIKEILPKIRWDIHFKYLSENKREITLEKMGPGEPNGQQNQNRD